METMKNRIALEEKFAGFVTEHGVEIGSFSGGIDVFVSGADGVGMNRWMPKVKERPGTEIAILAVLADTRERRALIDDQSVENNPYLVEVEVGTDIDGEYYPVRVPEDAVTLVAVARRAGVAGCSRPITEAVMFPPD